MIIEDVMWDIQHGRLDCDIMELLEGSNGYLTIRSKKTKQLVYVSQQSALEELSEYFGIQLAEEE